MDIASRYAAVRERIDAACLAAGRSPDEVTLVAVSKRHPDAAVRALADLGHRDFGENQVQAWQARVEAFPELRWHLIGPVQTNKARFVAAGPPALLHTIDRPSLVDALARRLQPEQRLDVLLQVNIDHEPQKSGCLPGGAAALADQVAACPGLKLVGLMCIPRPASEAPPRPAFARLRELSETLSGRYELADGPPVLSMGMSDDFEDAIAEGSTLVRVGTAIFGARGA